MDNEEKKILILNQSRVESLLEALVDQGYDQKKLLDQLDKKKQLQIDTQRRFERKWSKFKLLAGLFAIVAPMVSLVTGIIDPSVDFPVIMERANRVFQSWVNFKV